MTAQTDHELEKLFKETAKPKKWLSPGLLRRVGESVGFLAFCYIVVVVVALVNGNSEVMGQFGDAFGALTSVFTLASLVGVVLTLRTQQEDLDKQRVSLHLQIREMKETRRELGKQTRHLESQAKEAKRAADASEKRAHEAARQYYYSAEPNFVLSRESGRLKDNFYGGRIVNTGAKVAEPTVHSVFPKGGNLVSSRNEGTLLDSSEHHDKRTGMTSHINFAIKFSDILEEGIRTADLPQTFLTVRYLASGEWRTQLYVLGKGTKTGWEFCSHCRERSPAEEAAFYLMDQDEQEWDENH